MAIKVPSYLYSVSADGTVAFAEQLTDRDFIESHAAEMSVDITDDDSYSHYSKQNEINKFIYNKFDNYVKIADMPNSTTLSASYAATASYVDRLDDTLQSIKSSSAVTLREQEFSTGGVAKVYTLYQGGKEINGVSKINIERDKYTTSGELITDETDGRLYLKLKFVDDSDIKIPVDKLIDIYKGYNTDTISLVIDNLNYVIANVREGSITNEHISPDAKISISKIDLTGYEVTGSSILKSEEQGNLNLSFNGISIDSSNVTINGLSTDDSPLFNTVTSSKFVTIDGKDTDVVLGNGDIQNIDTMISSSIIVQNGLNTINATLTQNSTAINNLNELVYSLHYKPSFTVSPSVIFQSATDSTISATASLQFDGTAQTDFEVSVVTSDENGSVTPVITDGTNRTFKIVIYQTPSNNKKINTITATISNKNVNYSTQISKTVTIVAPIYYGQSNISATGTITADTIAPIFDNLTSYNTAVISAINTTYTVNMTEDNYFYIAVPEYITQPSQISVGGFSGFFEPLYCVGTYSMNVQYDENQINIPYTFYRTQSPQISSSITYYIK